jgi:hypothetical protein
MLLQAAAMPFLSSFVLRMKMTSDRYPPGHPSLGMQLVLKLPGVQLSILGNLSQ